MLTQLFHDDRPLAPRLAAVGPSIFLAGPTSKGSRTRWRLEAVELLTERGFAGAVVIPEFRDRPFSHAVSYNILDWETTGIERATCRRRMRTPASRPEIPTPRKCGSRRPSSSGRRPTAKDGKFHIYDLTTPSRPHEQTIDGQPTAANLGTFFEEVARYPEGEVRYTLPGGGAGVAPTTGKTKWYEWVGYAGLAIAAIGLGLLTAGASIPATGLGALDPRTRRRDVMRTSRRRP